MTPAPLQRSASRSEEVRRQHRDAWLITLAVGGGIILFGNLLGIGPWWLASAVAACMIGYGIVIERSIDNADVPGDVKGDSIYYLGLLFTFAALVAALITFDWGTPADGVGGTTGSIRNFGIALLTTIVGLAGRVWLTMSQESPGDIVDTARSRLEETVSRMKESLDRARDDLDIMAHKFRDSSAGLGATATMIAEGTKRTAETCETLHACAEHIAGATEDLAREMDQLQKVSGSCSGALAGLHEHAHGLGRGFDEVQARLETRFATMQQQLQGATAAFDRINRVAGPAAERIADALRGVESTGDAVSAVDDALSGMRGSAERAKLALAGIADAVEGHDALPLWKESVSQLHEGSRGIRRIGRRAAAMNAGFEALAASLKAATDELTAVPGSARSINDRLRRAGPKVTASIAPVRDLARDLGADLAAAETTSAQLSGNLEDARRQARRLSDEMQEIAWVDAQTGPEAAPEGRIRRVMAGARHILGRWPGIRRLPGLRRSS